MNPPASSSINDDELREAVGRILFAPFFLLVSSYFFYRWWEGAFVRACGLFLLWTIWSCSRREGGWGDVIAEWKKDWVKVVEKAPVWLVFLSWIDPIMKLLFPVNGTHDTLDGFLAGLRNGTSGLGFSLIIFLLWVFGCLITNAIAPVSLCMDVGITWASFQLRRRPWRSTTELPLPLADRIYNLGWRHNYAVKTLDEHSSCLPSLGNSPTNAVFVFDAASAAVQHHTAAIVSTSTYLLEEAAIYLLPRLCKGNDSPAEKKVIELLHRLLMDQWTERRGRLRGHFTEMLEAAYVPLRWHSQERSLAAGCFRRPWICLAPITCWGYLCYRRLVDVTPFAHSPPPLLVPLLANLPPFSAACAPLKGQDLFAALKAVVQHALTAVEVGRAEEQLREGVLDAVLWWKERKNEEEAAEW